MILIVNKHRGRVIVVVGIEPENEGLMRRGQLAHVEGDMIERLSRKARGARLADVDVWLGFGSEAEIRAQLAGDAVNEPPVVDRLSDLKGILQSVLEQSGDVDGHHLENAIGELGQAVDGFEEADDGSS